jgi:hypothetical protein
MQRVHNAPVQGVSVIETSRDPGDFVEENRQDKNWRSYLLGIGLDGRDGEFRVTRSEDFQILGGSERTHRRMQDKIMHLEEELARDDRTIASLKPDEFDDVARFLKEK